MTGDTATRRRAMKIFAGAAGVVALGAGVRALSPAPRFFRWRGDVLGAAAEIALWHGNENIARGAIRGIESEIARLRRVFSLADAASEISRLNRDGELAAPSRELRELIETSQWLGDLSDGAFDISVQPLWRLYEARFWSKTDMGSDLAAKARETARALVDYRAIDASAKRVAFARPGMSITLNGIAQGFVADAVADVLRNEGFETAFLDLGEMRALGSHPEGRPWRVDLKDPRDNGVSGRALELADSALAVSGGYGTKFEPTGRYHHIFNPRSGDSARELLDVAVIGPRATMADGLSTAIFVAGEAKAARLLAAFPFYRGLVTRADGEGAAIG